MVLKLEKIGTITIVNKNKENTTGTISSTFFVNPGVVGRKQGFLRKVVKKHDNTP